jgi:hypothetical protein
MFGGVGMAVLSGVTGNDAKQKGGGTPVPSPHANGKYHPPLLVVAVSGATMICYKVLKKDWYLQVITVKIDQ